MPKAPVRDNAPTDVRQVLRQIEWAVSEPDPHSLVMVGIGGFGASGKTTFAGLVSKSHPKAQIVATDEFFDGESFDLDRLRTDVVDVLRTRKPATYRPWNWATGTTGDERLIKPRGLVVIEGVCALHEMFRDQYAVRIWIDTPADIRLERAIARDGESSREQWLTVWMPNEAAYADRDQPVACAHAIVDGTRILA
jgi:uridine kinase